MADSSAKSLGVFSPSVLRRLLVIFVPAALLTGAVVFALYYQDVAKEHTLYQQAGDHLVNLQAEIINRELKTVEADVLYLASKEVLEDYLLAPDKRKRLEAQYARFCQQRAVYDQIRYLEKDGWERIRINHRENGPPQIVAEKGLQNKADRYYFQKTMDLKRGQVFVSPFDLNKETKDLARGPEIEKPLKPCIRFATPVFDEKENKRGIVVLNYLGAVLLRRLAEVSVTFPGSAFLLNHEGYFLRGPTPEDEWGFMLDHERSFASYYPQEWQGLAGLERGQFQAARGLFTVRSLSLRPQFAEHRSDATSTFDPRDPDDGEAGLIIVSYVPAAELNRRAAQLLHTLLLLAGVVLLVIFVLAWYLA